MVSPFYSTNFAGSAIVVATGVSRSRRTGTSRSVRALADVSARHSARQYLQRHSGADGPGAKLRPSRGILTATRAPVRDDCKARWRPRSRRRNGDWTKSERGRAPRRRSFRAFGRRWSSPSAIAEGEAWSTRGGAIISYPARAFREGGGARGGEV